MSIPFPFSEATRHVAKPEWGTWQRGCAPTYQISPPHPPMCSPDPLRPPPFPAAPYRTKEAARHGVSIYGARVAFPTFHSALPVHASYCIGDWLADEYLTRVLLHRRLERQMPTLPHVWLHSMHGCEGGPATVWAYAATEPQAQWLAGAYVTSNRSAHARQAPRQLWRQTLGRPAASPHAGAK